MSHTRAGCSVEASGPKRMTFPHQLVSLVPCPIPGMGAQPLASEGTNKQMAGVLCVPVFGRRHANPEGRQNVAEGTFNKVRQDRRSGSHLQPTQQGGPWEETWAGRWSVWE